MSEEIKRANAERLWNYQKATGMTKSKKGSPEYEKEISSIIKAMEIKPTYSEF